MNTPLANTPTSRAARWGEPWRFGFPGQSAAEYVEGAGLRVVVDEAAVAVATRYTQRPDGTRAQPAIPTTGRGAGIRCCVAHVP